MADTGKRQIFITIFTGKWRESKREKSGKNLEIKQKMKINKEQLQVYAVTDRKSVNKKRYATLIDAVEAAIKGGATIVQLREKELSEGAFLAEAKEIKKLTGRYGIPLIINDNVALAKACHADGVHLGQGDMQVEEARAILGDAAIIGVSAHNVEEALLAEKQGADYLGSGSAFVTTTKQDVTALPLKTLREICHAVQIPVVAIGGVSAENINQLVGCDVAGVAVVSAIFAQDEIETATKKLTAQVKDMLAKTETFDALYQKLMPLLQGKKGVLFDMDGTLIDSMPMWRTLDVEYIGRYGIHPDMEFHHQVATMTLIQAANFIKEQFDIPKTSEEIFNDFQNMVIEEYRNTIPLKPYARELVKWMKRDGYKVAVATANEIHLSEMVLERTGLMADVDTIVSCTMSGASKESPAVYELACANMRITPVECVIFEDSLRAMYTAKKAGFVTVAVYDDVAKDSWEEICRITDEQVVLE